VSIFRRSFRKTLLEIPKSKASFTHGDFS